MSTERLAEIRTALAEITPEDRDSADNTIAELLDVMDVLIHATGFDTFGQALEFIHESRSISDAAQKTFLPPATEEQRKADEQFRDRMRKGFGNIETMKAQEEINELRAERDKVRHLHGLAVLAQGEAVKRAESMERLYAQQVKEHAEANAMIHDMQAKLSERKTVHEWLNTCGIPREEDGRQLCLLRRLRIACDLLQQLPIVADDAQAVAAFIAMRVGLRQL